MASSRKPGSLGAEGIVPNIEDGTLVRAAAPTTGPVGLHGELSINIKPNRQRTSHQGLPTLRKGAQGKYVRRLQVVLNQHTAAPPLLKEDGYFGPKTLGAVIYFQRSVSLSFDGVVGTQTWLKLLAPEAGPRPSIPKKSSAAAPVATWSLRHRFEEVLRLAPNHMAPELAAQFRAMLTPVNVGIFAGTLAAWAVSHAFGVGEAADIAFLVVGAIFLGMAVFTAGEDIGECVKTTLEAETQADLDKAADYLAQAVAILGVVAFFSLLAKVGAKFGRAAGAGEEDAAASANTAAKPAARPPETRVVDEPAEPAPRLKNSVASEVENTAFKGAKLRVRPGANDKVAVIGRSMNNVVKPYAEGPGAKYAVETFSGNQVSEAAAAQWDRLKLEYAPNRIPDDVARNSLMFQENQAWAQKLVDQNYTVIDADNPGGEGSSQFYDMEKQILFGDPPAGAK